MMFVPDARKYFPFFFLLPVYFLVILPCVFGQMHPVADSSTVQFTIRNFGFKTGGKLDAPQGDILFNPDDLTRSSFQVSIKSASINTGNDSRDEHLRETDYFDVKNHPLIRFVSSSIHATGGKDNYEAVGTLTIKNKSQVIKIPFIVAINAKGWVFTGHFKMNRRDFEVGGSSTISDELMVDIKVLAR